MKLGEADMEVVAYECEMCKKLSKLAGMSVSKSIKNV
jgi:hypothetical protein